MRTTFWYTLFGVVAVGSLATGVGWLWTNPVAGVPSRAFIGKLDLEQNGAVVQVRFAPPRNLMSITIVFPGPTQGSVESRTQPDFPLSLWLRVFDTAGRNVFEDHISHDQMQWKNWHRTPSLLLMLHDQLGDHLRSDREYDLELTVNSAVADLGQARVFLHWMDRAYIWGREEQELCTSDATTIGNR